MLIREKYLSKIRGFYDETSLIKIIYGMRRSGKSVILNQIIDEVKAKGVADENIIYINFESLKYDFIKDAKDLYNYICCFNEDVNGVYNPYDFKHCGMDKMMRQLQMMTDNDIPLLLEQQTEKQIKMLKEV